MTNEEPLGVMLTQIVLVLVFLIILPILTFGHAATHTKSCSQGIEEMPCRGAVGLMATVAYPFYWSWKLWEE